MAIQWMDFPGGSPGVYGLKRSLLFDGPYAAGEAGLVEDPDPNTSGTVVQLQTSIGAGTALRKILPGIASTVGVAWRNWMAQLPPDTWRSWTLWIKDNMGNSLASFSIGPAGQMRVHDALGAVVATSAIDLIKTNSWQHIEIRYDFTAGNAEVYLNGDEIINEAVSLGTPTAAMVSWERNFNQQGAQYIKDYVIYDNSGGWGTGPLGTVAVYDLTPDGDVSSGWVPSVGTSAAAILDNTPPNDSAYITAIEDPIPAPAIVTLSSLPDDVTSVRAVMTIVRARKSDGGDGNLQVSLLSGGETDDGADRAITTAFTYFTDISHLDPDTGASWTPAAVDDVELSINRTL